MNDRRKAFIHTGSDLEAKPFHYTQCGLDDVYLLNGFTLKTTSYGETFSIKNMEGLHRAIAHTLIYDRKSLNGKEVRFLRKELRLTQEQLGEVIGVSAQQVARYEKEETPIQGAPLLMLRTHFLTETLPDDETVGELKKTLADIKVRLAELADLNRQIFLKAEKSSEWNTVPAAA